MTPNDMPDPQVAHRIFDVLVNRCGAQEHHREPFVRYLADPTRSSWEYRFQGALGFGGKCYIDDWGVTVRCYPEDETPERRAMINAANKELTDLWLTR